MIKPTLILLGLAITAAPLPAQESADADAVRHPTPDSLGRHMFKALAANKYAQARAATAFSLTELTEATAKQLDQDIIKLLEEKAQDFPAPNR